MAEPWRMSATVLAALIRDRQVAVQEVIGMQRRQLLNLKRLVETA